MATGDGMLSAVILVLSLNLIMFFVGYGLTDLGAPNDQFAYANNTLTHFNGGNSTSFDVPTDAGNLLPSGQATGVGPDTGFSLTDIFASIGNWFADVTGLAWVLSILSAPKVILTAMGLPVAAAWAITALWYGVTLLMVVAFIWGR